MRKKVLPLVLVALLFVGCAVLCKTSPQVISALDITISTLKVTVDQLQNYIIQLQVYDPIIELAYAEAKALLAKALELQKQKCPAEVEANAIVTKNTYEVQPLAAKADVRAAMLGLKKMK